MARQYAPKAVMRHLPLPLIREFIHKQNIKTGSEWEALVEGDTNALHQAWSQLEQQDRSAFEDMLRLVHGLASEAGVRTLIAEARYHQRDIADQLAELEGHHAKALWVFIHCGPVFHTASQLLSVAAPFGRFWNLTAGLEGLTYDSSPTALQSFRAHIIKLYREQGRGHRCTIDSHEREGIHYHFLYLDDYIETHTAHDDLGRLVRKSVRPAFEVVYVYNSSVGTLDLFARGERRWRAALRDAFCDHLLHTSTAGFEFHNRAYKLNSLIYRQFARTTDPARGILNASIRRMRVVANTDRSRRVTLEANPNLEDDVYDMLDLHFPVAQFPRHTLTVTMVTFTVRYVLTGEDRVRQLTFDVSLPDASNLRSLAHDQREVGEWCLRQWGILDESGDLDDENDQDDRRFTGDDRAA